jgi:hypothetical protein
VLLFSVSLDCLVKLICGQFKGLYVIALDGLENMSSHPEAGELLHPNLPNITGSGTSKRFFESLSLLRPPSCLQVTDTALWFTWDRIRREHRSTGLNCMLAYSGHSDIANDIHFSSSPSRDSHQRQSYA